MVREIFVRRYSEIEQSASPSEHELLVRYAWSVCGEPRTAPPVWAEHSYARPRRSALRSRNLRVLLAPLATTPPPLDDDTVDVERLSPPPPEPPLTADDEMEVAIDQEEEEALEIEKDPDEWERRVAAVAPSPRHTRLAECVAELLRDARLAWLAGARPALRPAFVRLRRALATHCSTPGSSAAWLHAALGAHLPPPLRRLYDALLHRLRRRTPRLAARLAGDLPPLAAGAPPSPPPPNAPRLLWLSGGGRSEARWPPALRPLLQTRVVQVRAPPGPAAAPAEWCARAVAAARADLFDAVAEAGEGGLVVGGAGAGAAVAVALCSGAATPSLRGLVLLAPPLRTLEGLRTGPDDQLRELALPMLLVAGTGGAQGGRGDACELACAAPMRRLLLLSGADDALRLTPSHARRLRLAPRALTALVAEEVARWACEVVDETAEEETDADEAQRPQPLASDAPSEPLAKSEGETGHLGTPSTPGRAIEIVEGRVVSRVCGGTPLQLPRRQGAAPAAAALASPRPSPHDIMHMPIVFADDEPALVRPHVPLKSRAPPPDADAAVTVTSGAHRRSSQKGRGAGGPLQYTRVIVAKRPGEAKGPAGSSRPVLLRRAVRVVPR